MLGAGISPACALWPEWLEAESARPEQAPLAFWIADALRPRSLVDLETRDGYSYFAFRYPELHTPIRPTFDDVLPHFAYQTIDLLHIDGRHDYAQIKCHFVAWRPRLSDRGVVLFYDTNERAAALTAIRRRDVQAEAACAA
jgi:hypothetical protein